MKRVAFAVVLLAVGAATGAWWWSQRAQRGPKPLALYGNIDLRQVELAFNNSERIVEVLAQEGERVTRGQPLARLDRRRLEPQVAQATAQVAAQRQVVERQHNGSRPEEIAQARANVASALAEVANVQLRYRRLQKLSAVRLPSQALVQAVSQEDLDDTKAMLDEAEAKLTVNQQALELAVAGPRHEDVAQAEAQLRGNEAQLAWLRQQLADTELAAPSDAVVRSRLLEPGEMSSPQRPVFSLAITDPKWVRAYVSEADLGRVRPGETARVTVDSFPDRRFEGWVGFISPVAEFTPKTVQIEELRPSLVYEVRVFVKDAGDDLRLGMPATVTFPPDQADSRSTEQTP